VQRGRLGSQLGSDWRLGAERAALEVVQVTNSERARRRIAGLAKLGRSGLVSSVERFGRESARRGSPW